MPNPQNLKNFKKGEDNRRNLKGRPKGKLRDIKEVISNLLTQEKNNQQLIDGLMTVIVNKALKGDLKATEMLLAYTYGKPTQKTEISGSDGEKLDFSINVITGDKITPYKPE
jgi:hypothetical protein